MGQKWLLSTIGVHIFFFSRFKLGAHVEWKELLLGTGIHSDNSGQLLITNLFYFFETTLTGSLSGIWDRIINKYFPLVLCSLEKCLSEIDHWLLWRKQLLLICEFPGKNLPKPYKTMSCYKTKYFLGKWRQGSSFATIDRKSLRSLPPSDLVFEPTCSARVQQQV